VTVPRFGDHAANERTFLAWVRTAIAVMAFGFLVERFNLFLQVAGQSLGRTFTVSGTLASDAVGIALIIAGALMVAAAMLRFVANRRAILDEAARAPGNDRLDLALAGMIVALGLGLAAYLAVTILRGAG
jgi:putative membrane protein